MSEITLVLEGIGRGDKQASEDLLPLVYGELRRLAAAKMAREAEGQTIQPTELVHEAWLRLVGDAAQTWQNRNHFLGAAAEAMRRILVDRARRKSAVRHGGGQFRLDIEGLDLAAAGADDKILLVDEALEQLREEDPEKARIVTLKFFGGLTNQEIAAHLNLGERTVERQWSFAKAWLLRAIRARS
ncbi:MAG: sigma-70 family RNA polymerase sigma factor [Verrucomicrobiota bacterium]|jgi:RNA polymerase sigma factor (TIGR02999 family)